MAICVAHVLDDLAASSGGTVRACVDLCEALARETTCRPVIFTQRREANEVPVEKEVEVYRLSAGRGLLRLRRSREILEEKLHLSGAQLVHINGLWSPFLHAAVQASRRLGIPLIISPHGMLEPWSLNQKKLKKWLALRFYQRGDLDSASLVHSTASSEELNLRNLGFAHTFTLPNGVPERAVMKRLSCGDQRQALFLSRIHPKKGIENLLRAWAAVRPGGWQLKIVGPGEQRYVDRLHKLRNELRLNETVRFEPPADAEEKWNYYESSDLFVLPTFSENFGIVVAEALQSGVPVITTHEAPWECLLDHGCGWWVPAQLAPLTAAIRDATSRDRSVLFEMGKRGQQLVASKFLWRGIAHRMNETYERLVNPSCEVE